MFYTIYRITSKIDGKIYIGKHKTKKLNDEYLGSGNHLRRAIAKHGKENFTKEILYVFSTEAEMNAKERELVTDEFCKRSDTFNICEGGLGGWSYVNRQPFMLEVRLRAADKGRRSEKRIGLKRPDSAAIIKDVHERGLVRYDGFKGKTHSDENKKKFSELGRANTGVKNSQFGRFWITNGIDNAKCSDINRIPNGWIKGRIIRKK